jgi:hypothetical protein
MAHAAFLLPIGRNSVLSRRAGNEFSLFPMNPHCKNREMLLNRTSKEAKAFAAR